MQESDEMAGAQAREQGSVTWDDVEPVAEEVRDYLAQWTMASWQDGIDYASAAITDDAYQRLAAHALAHISSLFGANERLIELLEVL